MNNNWDQEFDLLVVGSGGGGMTAIDIAVLGAFVGLGLAVNIFRWVRHIQANQIDDTPFGGGMGDALDENAELLFEEDPQLPRGSCLAETESGLVDGSVEVQLVELERALLADMSSGEQDG